MNKIITLLNVGYKIDDNNFIKNLNLDFYSGENVLISGKDSVISNLMIDLITGFIKPQIGNVSTQSFNEKRYFIGYNNFESVLKHGAQVQDIINTLVSSQRYLVNDDNEVNELIGLFSLDNILKKSTNDLNDDQLFLLNLTMLLIVKPRIIILKKLPLLGSANFQLSTLKYIYNYTKKYDISLIITTNSDAISENLIDRQLKIENGKIISDVSKSLIANYESHEVDNKTKEFNLENVLINALNNSFTEKDLDDAKSNNNFSEYNTIPINKTAINNLNNTNQTKQIEIDIPLNNSKTKTVKIEFDEHLDNYQPTLDFKPLTDEPKTNEDIFDYNKTINSDEFNNTNSIKTKNIKTNNLKRNTNVFLPNENNSMKFNTSALENDYEHDQSNNTAMMNEAQCEMVTKKLTDITKEFKEILTDDNTNPTLENANTSQVEIVEAKIAETFYLKKELDAQVKDPEFLNLSINLQSQILDNLERANEILEKDVQNVTSKLYNDVSLTKMIIDEDDDADVADENNKTSIIDITNQENSNTKKTMSNDVANERSDLFYYDNEKPNSLYDLWRNKRKNKNIHKTRQLDNQDKIDNQANNELPTKVNITEQIDNFTTNLKIEDEIENDYESNQKIIDNQEIITPEKEISTPEKQEDTNINSFLDLGINNTERFTSKYETNKPTKELLGGLENIEINSKTGTFGLSDNEDESNNVANNMNNQQEEIDIEQQKSDIEIRTLEIKQRSKLNTIEKLYQEALEDLNIVEEQKNKHKPD